MPLGAPSLKDMARRVCSKHVKRIEHVDMAPYMLIRPVLQKIENPGQLRELELNSPHLEQEDSELWLEFIKRDIPFWDEVELPEKPDYQTYSALRRQLDLELEEDASRMEQAMKGLDKEKEKHGAKIVDHNSRALPKLKPSRQEKFAYYDRIMGGIETEFVVNERKANDKGCNPYERNARYLVKQPKLSSIIPAKTKPGLPAVFKRNSRMEVPTHKLNVGAPPLVARPPRAFVADHARAAGQPLPPRANSNPMSAIPTQQVGRPQAPRPSVSRVVSEPNPHNSDPTALTRPAAAVLRPKNWTSVTASGLAAVGVGSSAFDACNAFLASPISNRRRSLKPSPPQKPSPLVIPKRRGSKDVTPCPTPSKPPTPVQAPAPAPAAAAAATAAPRPVKRKRPADNPLLMKPKRPRPT